VFDPSWIRATYFLEGYVNFSGFSSSASLLFVTTDGLILDRVSTVTSPDFNNLSPSRLWYHSRGLLVNDLDGQTLSVNPQNNNWYPTDKDGMSAAAPKF